MRSLSLILPWMLSLTAWAGVESVPRPAPGRWSVDTTGKLSPQTLAEVDRLGAEVNASGQGQLAVVVVGTIGGLQPRLFATELFNRWGIGHAGRNDGALLFVALEDRAAEIILGRGVSTNEDLARSDALMSGSIVPAFKRGSANSAVLSGARGLRELLARAPLNTPDRGLFGAIAEHLVWSSLGGGLLVFVGLLLWSRSKSRPPCPKCGQRCQPLSPRAARDQLNPGQRQELKLHRASYRVWWCARCQQTKVVRFQPRSLRNCPGCDYDTAEVLYEILQEATPEQPGVMEQQESCGNCGHQSVSLVETSWGDPLPFNVVVVAEEAATVSFSGFDSSSSSPNGSFGGGNSSGSGSSGSW